MLVLKAEKIRLCLFLRRPCRREAGSKATVGRETGSFPPSLWRKYASTKEKGIQVKEGEKEVSS